MLKAVRVVLALGAVGLVGVGTYMTLMRNADRGSSCTYRYIYPDDAELARRLTARAGVVIARAHQQSAVVSIYDDDEWWRRARFLPKAGVVDCGTSARWSSTPSIQNKSA